MHGNQSDIQLHYIEYATTMKTCGSNKVYQQKYPSETITGFEGRRTGTGEEGRRTGTLFFRKLWIRARPYNYLFFFSLGGASAGRFELCQRLATGPAVRQFERQPGG